MSVPVTDMADAFLKYKIATESLGSSQEDVLDFTKRVTQAMILSGATSADAHRAAVQLAQGFGKNFKAAAQDLKSVKEQAPILAKIIEKAAGGAPGSLLALAQAGKITSKIVFDGVRAAGAELDKDFAERQKTFANIGDLLGNVWLQAIKRLKPAFTPVIDMLERIVHWVGEWVKDGSSLNAIITAAIIAVGLLTAALAPLILSAIATATPFVLLFLLLEDFITFMRGGDSITGRFFEQIFGEGGAEKARAWVESVWDKLKEFASWLADPSRWAATWKGLYDGLVLWMGKAVEWAKTKITELGDAITAELRSALGDTAADFLGVPKTGQREYERAMGARDDRMSSGQAEVEAGYAARDSRQFQDQLQAAINAGGNTGVWENLKTSFGNLVSGGDRAFQDNRGLPDPMAPPDPAWAFRNAKSYSDIAPVINNTITVNGNADAPVAREIATRTGAATAGALGRDRSAIGAGFGVAQ